MTILAVGSVELVVLSWLLPLRRSADRNFLAIFSVFCNSLVPLYVRNRARDVKRYISFVKGSSQLSRPYHVADVVNDVSEKATILQLKLSSCTSK